MADFAELPEGFTPLPDTTGMATEPTTDFITTLPEGFEAIDPDTEEPRKGYFERVSEKIGGRIEAAKTTLEDFSTGDLGYGPSAVARAAGQVAGKYAAGSWNDILGETVSEGLRGLSLIVPDSWQDATKEYALKAWNTVANTSAGEEALEALEGGVKTYDKWAKANPQSAKDIESLVNIGIFLAPVKTKAGAGPIEKLSDETLGAAGRALVKSGEKAAAKNKAEFIRDLIFPKQTAAARQAAVKQTKEVPLIPGTNILPRGEVVQTASEKAISDQVMKIPGLKSNMNLQKSYSVIAEHNDKLVHDLARKVAIERKPINKIDVNNNIVKDTVAHLKDNPVLVNSSGAVNNMLKQASKIINRNRPTAAGLLKARKEFDQWVQGVKGGVDLASDTHGMLDVAAKSIRNSMTRQLDENISSVAVKKALREQSLLYDALDLVRPKAADYTRGRWMRIWQNTTRALGFQRQAAQEIAFSTGIGQMSAATLMAPVYAVGLVGMGAKAGFQSLYGPTTRKAAGTMLKQVNKAIKTSTNPDMIRQLRADRAFLVDLMKEKQEEAIDE